MFVVFFLGGGGGGFPSLSSSGEKEVGDFLMSSTIPLPFQNYSSVAVDHQVTDPLSKYTAQDNPYQLWTDAGQALGVTSGSLHMCSNTTCTPNKWSTILHLHMFARLANSLMYVVECRINHTLSSNLSLWVSSHGCHGSGEILDRHCVLIRHMN